MSITTSWKIIVCRCNIQGNYSSIWNCDVDVKQHAATSYIARINVIQVVQYSFVPHFVARSQFIPHKIPKTLLYLIFHLFFFNSVANLGNNQFSQRFDIDFLRRSQDLFLLDLTLNGDSKALTKSVESMIKFIERKN